LNIAKDITICAWIKFNALNYWSQVIVGKWSSLSSHSYVLYLYNLEGGQTGKLGFSVSYNNDLRSGISLEAEKWYFLTGIYNQQYNCYVLYVNGVGILSSVFGGGISQSNEPLYIGGDTESEPRYFDGIIDEVRIYDRVLSDSEIQTLYEQCANQPPIANFTYSPFNPTDLDIIQFTDTSTDADGTKTSWNWNFGDGNTSVLQNPTHKYADEGTYHVVLNVTDNDGASNSLSKDVIVNNVPPIANAGGPYYGSKVIPVIFDATNSKDLDGSIVLYTWDFGDGKTGSGSITTHQYTANGNYIATLSIKDDDGATDTDTAVVHIITGNLPPYIPKNPHPGNNAVNVSIEPILSWTGGDPDIGDTVTYDVYFGSMPPFEKVASNISTPSFEPGALANGLTYFWNVVAWDNHGASTNGPGWYFTTLGTTNHQPSKPSKPSGPTNGKHGQEYSYTTSTTDPDGDKVYYMWDWGDGNYSEWLGPNNSGATCKANHTWSTKGSYSIKVKAKDIYNATSDWSDPLPITMPYSYQPIHQFLEWLFERFPNAFPILKQLLGY